MLGPSGSDDCRPGPTRINKGVSGPKDLEPLQASTPPKSRCPNSEAGIYEVLTMFVGSIVYGRRFENELRGGRMRPQVQRGRRFPKKVKPLDQLVASYGA